MLLQLKREAQLERAQQAEEVRQSAIKAAEKAEGDAIRNAQYSKELELALDAKKEQANLRRNQERVFNIEYMKVRRFAGQGVLPK